MLNLTYLYAHKGKPIRTHGFDEILNEEKIEDGLIEHGFSSPPSLYPVVVWRCTRACNLDCIHCYANASHDPTAQELSTDEGEKLIDDLDKSGVSSLVFSGGEPLLRKDFFELARYAKSKDMGVILSTNGTLLTENRVEELKTIGFSYVSMGLAGIGQVNDSFRRQEGAFQKAVQGIELCQQAKLPLVLRINLTRHNVLQLHSIFKFIENQKIETVFFYHLFPSGRGMERVDPLPEETQHAIDFILKATRELNTGDRTVRVFVAGNVCDGAYLYKVLADEKDPQAWLIHDYLTGEKNRFGAAGSDPFCIDWNGNIHPNQFRLDKTLGNIRRKNFLEIVRPTSDTGSSVSNISAQNIRKQCAQCHHVALCMNGFQPAFLSDEELHSYYPPCYLVEAEASTAH